MLAVGMGGRNCACSMYWRGGTVLAVGMGGTVLAVCSRGEELCLQ